MAILTGVDKHPSRAKGISLFCIDPGETNGWAWGCFGWKELRKQGVVRNLFDGARKDTGGLQLGDTRLSHGEVNTYAPHRTDLIGIMDWQAAEMLISTLEVCGGMGNRRSAGAVPHVTDVVVEDFVLRRRTMTRDLLSPVRITAAIYVLLAQHQWPMRVHLQSASDKSVINDERLRALGLWVPGSTHARDAYRHLALHLRKLAGST